VTPAGVELGLQLFDFLLGSQPILLLLGGGLALLLSVLVSLQLLLEIVPFLLQLLRLLTISITLGLKRLHTAENALENREQASGYLAIAVALQVVIHEALNGLRDRLQVGGELLILLLELCELRLQFTAAVEVLATRLRIGREQFRFWHIGRLELHLAIAADFKAIETGLLHVVVAHHALSSALIRAASALMVA